MITKSIQDSQRSLEKLTFFLVSETQNLHLKKLGVWAIEIDAAQLITRFIKILSPVNVLELGSGASTILISRRLREFPNSRLYSIEHSPKYLSETLKFLALNELENIELVYCPLNNGWYQRDLQEHLPVFDLIFIDGPINDRVNGIEFIKSHSSSKTIFIIDDYGRNETAGLVEALTSNDERYFEVFDAERSVAVVGDKLLVKELMLLV